MPFRVRRALRLLVGCLLAAAPCAHAAVSLEVYGRLPRLEHIALSPDGTRVAFVRTDGDERVLAIMALATGQVVARLRAGNEKLRGIEWADDAHVLIKTSVTGVLHGNLFRQHQLSEWFQMQVYDLTSGRLFPIPRNIGSANLALLNVIAWADVRRVKDRTLIFVTGYQIGRGGGPVLLSVSLDTQTVRLVTQAKPDTVGWALDGDGEVVAEETYDQRSGHWSILIHRDGRMQEAVSGIGLIDVPYFLGRGRPPTPCWYPASRTRSRCGGCCRSRTGR
jgi:hypothetical protein